MDRIPGDIVISGRFQQTILWGMFIIILALGLVTALHAQPTTAGKGQSVAFFGAFIIACVLLWWRRNRRRPRLQVTGQEIRFWDGGGNLSFMLSASAGQPPTLCLLPPRRDGGYYVGRRLTIPGSGDYLNVSPFRARRVRRECESRGWQFNDDAELLAREASRLAGVLAEMRQQRRLPR